MEMPSISSTPRMVEDIFKSFSARRSTIVRALTSDVNEFYSLCDPGEQLEISSVHDDSSLSSDESPVGDNMAFELDDFQVNLIDWLKMMVGSRRSEEVVDPNMETKPSTRALKRVLLTAWRCVDPDSEKRPKMGQVVRMLESDEPIPCEN